MHWRPFMWRSTFLHVFSAPSCVCHCLEMIENKFLCTIFFVLEGQFYNCNQSVNNIMLSWLSTNLSAIEFENECVRIISGAFFDQSSSRLIPIFQGDQAWYEANGCWKRDICIDLNPNYFWVCTVPYIKGKTRDIWHFRYKFRYRIFTIPIILSPVLSNHTPHVTQPSGT